MAIRTPNFGLGIDGEICGCKTHMMIARENDDWSYIGKLSAENKRAGELLRLVDDKLAQDSVECESLIGTVSAEAVISHRKNKNYLSVQSGALTFTAFSDDEGAVMVMGISKSEITDEQGFELLLKRGVNYISEFLGIEQFTLFLKSGNIKLSGVQLPGTMEMPTDFLPMASYHLFVHGKFDFQKSGILFKEIFIRLFGLKEMEMFLAFQSEKKEYACYMKFPCIDNKLLRCENMHFYLRKSAEVAFGICGKFQFHFLGNMTFELDCSLREGSFSLAASGEPGAIYEILPGFLMQDTTLLIGYYNGISLGLITRLKIRDLDLFAGLKLSVYGEVINLSLITMALYQITIPKLMDNFLGFHIPGIEVMDVIKIDSFDLKTKKRYEKGTDIVAYINENAVNPSWRLGKETTQIREQKNGIAILDEQRMCHYYIDKDGNLSLQAQVYYATETCALGSYQITKGIFVCAELMIFGKKIKALLSMKEGEGLVAFAQIDEIDLGFFKISASSASSSMKNPMLADGNTMLAQFVEAKNESAVFYLSANGKDVSFYLDGRLELCHLFSVDARVIYMKKMIAVDVKFLLLEVLDVHLKMEVQYQDLNSGCFRFYLLIDAGKLEAKLESVKQNINRAIEKCRKAIHSATEQLDDAKERVNQLHCEIESLDRKIEACRKTIWNTSKWKRWAVAIYKGAEILTYEVAKGALYVAIGTAKAALEVAKAAVQFGGIMGEGVLQIAKGVVTASMNLFFLRKIELAIDVNKEKQSVHGNIEFVALGKEYKYEASFDKSFFSAKPTEAIEANINGVMEKDLGNIDKGSFKSNRDKYRRKADLKKDRKHLETGMAELGHAVNLITDMQEIYVTQTKEMMPEFELLSGEYVRSLSDIENTMAFVSKSIDLDSLQEPMEKLENAIEDQAEIDRGKALETLEQYHEARTSFAQMKESIESVQKMRNELELVYQGNKKMADQMMQKGEESLEGSMEAVINAVEMSMCTKHFRATPRDTGYIQLGKERALANSFAEFRNEKQYETPREIEKVREKTRAMRYENRI